MSRVAFYVSMVNAYSDIYWWLYEFLEVKASKGMHKVCIEKITWLPLIHTSALKIVPQVVWVYTVGFVKCFDIAVFCFYSKSVQSIVKSKKKWQYFYWFKCILHSFKLSLLTGFSELWFKQTWYTCRSVTSSLIKCLHLNTTFGHLWNSHQT